MATRNPLIHSFTLHSDEYQMRRALFQGQGHPVWLRKSDSKQVIVSIAGVFDAFVRAVRAYEEDLREAGCAMLRPPTDSIWGRDIS